MKNSTFSKRYEKQLQQAETFNLSEVTYYMRCSRVTIFNYVNKRGFPRQGGRGTGIEPYYVKKEVDEWVKKNPRFMRW